MTPLVNVTGRRDFPRSIDRHPDDEPASKMRLTPGGNDELVRRARVGAEALVELESRASYPSRDQWAVRSHYWKLSPECAALRCAIKALLMGPTSVRWTVQGFGMLRTYLPFGPNPKRFRLNVWNADLSVPAVSTIHDHPWDFTSWIINGEFANVRFVEDHFSGEEYEYMKIMCGECGGSTDKPTRMRLRELPVEHYHTGDIYHQDASEVHLSGYDPGTVTLNDRVGDTEHARVFWPAGSAWVDAKPREATGQEILRTTSLALERWTDEIPNRD